MKRGEEVRSQAGKHETYIHPTLLQCWHIVLDAGLALKQHCPMFERQWSCQQIGDGHLMLVYCWSNVCHAGKTITLKAHVHIERETRNRANLRETRGEIPTTHKARNRAGYENQPWRSMSHDHATMFTVMYRQAHRPIYIYIYIYMSTSVHEEKTKNLTNIKRNMSAFFTESFYNLCFGS